MVRLIPNNTNIIHSDILLSMENFLANVTSNIHAVTRMWCYACTQNLADEGSHTCSALSQERMESLYLTSALGLMAEEEIRNAIPMLVREALLNVRSVQPPPQQPVPAMSTQTDFFNGDELARVDEDRATDLIVEVEEEVEVVDSTPPPGQATILSRYTAETVSTQMAVFNGDLSRVDEDRASDLIVEEEVEVVECTPPSSRYTLQTRTFPSK